MSEEQTITLNGEEVAVRGDETLLSIAARHGLEIPTLCHDPRLAPVGACRTCLVEIEGWRRLAPACATKVEPGMVVTTENERILRHQRGLMALYLSDHEAENGADGRARSEVFSLAESVGAPMDWPRMAHQRPERPEDRNPYVHFDASRCILCARCTRYCDEVEGVSAITLAGRGTKTTISTADGISLMDSSCELCGGCIDVCPTGAMTEKMPLFGALAAPPDLEKVRTTCNYCGVGCQMDLEVDPDANQGRGRVVRVHSPEAGTTTNDGNLCVKGRFAYDFIENEDRLTQPLIRGEDGQFREASWEEALAYAAQGLRAVEAQHGTDGLAFISSSRCTMEENYLVQKLARAVFRTNNVHQCAAT